MQTPRLFGRAARNAPRSRHPEAHGFDWLRMALVALGIAVWLVAMGRLLAGPSFVERIVVVNPTAYDVEVAVTDGERDGWLGLGAVEDGTTQQFQAVLDQGDVWIVRFADGKGGELQLTRDELRRVGWRIEVPRDTEARLRPSWGPPELLAD